MAEEPNQREKRQLPAPRAAPPRGAHWIPAAAIAAIAVVLVASAYLTSAVQDAVRAYISGEALWSKAQKDAVYELERFVDTGNPVHLERFRRAIAVPLADREAREALEKTPPDREAAAAALLRAGHDPEDIPALIRLFAWREFVPLMPRAVAVWREGDREIARLCELASRLERRASDAGRRSADLDPIVAGIEEVNERVTILEREFSATLAEGARRLLGASRLFTVAAGLLLAIAGILLVRRTARASRKAHDRWQRARRLEALARLAGGVAHDFNNLMTAVLGHADLLERVVAHSPEGNLHLREIRRAVERASKLARQMLAFGRRQALAPERLDAREVIRELAPMFRGVLPEETSLAIDAGSSPLPVEADRLALEQALMNILLNARDAVEGGGRIAVRARAESLGAGAAPELAPGRYAVIEVEDSGAGMDETTRQRIFEPFFTTKGAGRGTGLGLSMAYGVARQSGGGVTVDSRPGRGTTVRVYLPLAPPRRSGATPRPEAHPPGPRATILLVEDDPEVRRLLERALALQGHRVISAAGGEEALEAARRHPGPIDLLITDVIMPGRSGPSLARELQSSRPEMRVLFISGYPGEELERHGVPRDAELLPKPFGPLALQVRVEKILSRSRPAAGG